MNPPIESCLLFDLSAQAKVAVTGPEAGAFLHNLCTQDIKGLPTWTSREAFLCTAKARVVAHVWVSHVPLPPGEHFLLDADPGQAERLVKHLNHYLISEQAEIADVTGEYGLLRLAGPGAEQTVGRCFGKPLADLGVGQLRDLGAGIWVRRLDLLAMPTFDLFCSAGETTSLRERLLSVGDTLSDAQTYEVLRVEAGLPRIGIDMDENRFVVETGRIAQAISYAKGCYLGQEPIVMARDRGQVNRKLLGVRFDDGPLPEPGSKLFRGTEEVGLVTSTVQSPRFGAIGLAYVRRGSQEPGTVLTLEPGGGRQALLASLPFGGGGSGAASSN